MCSECVIICRVKRSGGVVKSSEESVVKLLRNGEEHLVMRKAVLRFSWSNKVLGK